MVKGSIPNLPFTQVSDDPYDCVKNVYALVGLTEWVNFVELDMGKMSQSPCKTQNPFYTP
ncbi:MAG: hypothetical protein CM15mP49_16540 [Actinomycetota bacterium]|nr:MAG: hypothetical protein CM15mP49_16540 [Actinomycetota bacterium]